MSTPKVVAVTSLVKRGRPVEEPILIGKDILELITGAMYVEPLCIYREYIQNACDAIDEAVDRSLYGLAEKPAIKVSLDFEERSVKIRDNGIGIPQKEFVGKLTAIGGSSKRGANLRGFRGVGRLSGLGYCQELVFRSKAPEDNKVSEILWNGRRLKELLRAANTNTGLTEAIREIAEVRSIPADGFPARFFEVELRKVTRLKNDVLLNEGEIRDYLSQVAPVPFRPGFRYAQQIEHILRPYNADKTYEIRISEDAEPLYRPFKNRFLISNKVADSFTELRSLLFTSQDGDVGAVGWILNHGYLGAIPRGTLISGIRLRSGNIQIGSADLLGPQFPEARFNGWCVGELHIIDRKVVPNGRRDDFEPSTYYQHLIGQVSATLKELAKVCRDRSAARNNYRKAKTSLEAANDALSLFGRRGLPAYVVRFVEQRVSSARKEIEKLSNLELLAAKDLEDLSSQVLDLEAEFKRRSRRPKSLGIFKGMNRVRRDAYQEMLALIYEHSKDAAEAHRLVGKLTRVLAK